MNEAELIGTLSLVDEFSQLKIRNDEFDELNLLYNNQCHLLVTGGAENVHRKVNILIQSYISLVQLNSFSLISDMSYVNQNVLRLIRALVFGNLMFGATTTLSSQSSDEPAKLNVEFHPPLSKSIRKDLDFILDIGASSSSPPKQQQFDPQSKATDGDKANLVVQSSSDA